MLEIICVVISLVAFLAFLFISTFEKKHKSRKILKNICLIIIAAAQVILMKYANLSGIVGHLITVWFALYLLE